ncbi:MAG TPA: hypothetical protein VKX24_01125, partial [Acidimicrobiia bacterium]|nr:hypothetical protein [Acidimicrobiia bacterium]
RVHREPFSAQVAQVVGDLASRTGEVFFGRQRPDDQELVMDLLDPSDISEYLGDIPHGEIVFYGLFPLIEDNGVTALSFTPPDADGIVRPQPT